MPVRPKMTVTKNRLASEMRKRRFARNRQESVQFGQLGKLPRIAQTRQAMRGAKTAKNCPKLPIGRRACGLGSFRCFDSLNKSLYRSFLIYRTETPKTAQTARSRGFVQFCAVFCSFGAPHGLAGLCNSVQFSQLHKLHALVAQACKTPFSLLFLLQDLKLFLGTMNSCWSPPPSGLVFTGTPIPTVGATNRNSRCPKTASNLYGKPDELWPAT